MSGFVYLVGAGCGEADLITVRGEKLLKACDCLVYDDLIPMELLSMVRAECRCIYMGKRSGAHSAPQNEISEKLVELAKEGSTVVRLKGGDPFVFGRGGEEIIALQAAGIPFEVVPGISSCIAVPAAVGIPVTHRGSARSFHVVTGHTADTADSLPENLESLASCEGTLVFLMGLKNLRGIAEGLIRYGKAPATPAAVVSGANRAHPKAVRGTLSDIGELVEQSGITAPAVIVVGQVAALNFADRKELPLRDVRVGVSGTDAITEKLSKGLTAMGADVHLCLRSRVTELDFDVSAAVDGNPHWVVFTSSNGVRTFFRKCAQMQIDLRRFAAVRFAVIGSATAKTLASFGFTADLVPDEATSHGLGLALQNALTHGAVLLYRSARGSTELLSLLDEKGIAWQDIPTYDLLPQYPREVRADSMDYLVFSSASGVELFREHYGLPESPRYVCIGAVTAAALENHGISDYLLADEISADGILSAILEDASA